MTADQYLMDSSTMPEAALACIDAARTTKLKNDTLDNKILGAFMASTAWVLLQLSCAATEGRLINRLVELEDEWEHVLDHLRSAKPRDVN